MREQIRAFRLRLAQAVAPAGADVHDPDETACPHAQEILEAAQFGRLHPDPTDPTRWLIDLTGGVHDLASARWIVLRGGEQGFQGEITREGQEQLARLWGPERQPPWAKGAALCAEHGAYEVKPGALLGCVSCAVGRAIRNINTESASWWRRRRWLRVGR